MLHQLDRKKTDAFGMWFWGRILDILLPVDCTDVRAIAPIRSIEVFLENRSCHTLPT